MKTREWREVALGDLVENFDSVRVPVAGSKRVPGPYPYYGASGVVDHVSEYLLDGDYLLLGEDGENLRSRNTPVAFIASGRFWVNNHAHILRGKAGIADTRFLMHRLNLTDLAPYLSGSAQPKLSQASMNSIRLNIPPLPEQQAIAEVLGALDDKIAANRALVAIADTLSEATFASATAQLPRVGLDELVKPTSGGTPKREIREYWAGDIPWVSVKDIHSETAGAILATEEQISEFGAANSAARQVPAGTVILTARGTVGEVGRLTVPGAFNQSCYGFVPCEIGPAVLFHIIRAASASAKRVAHGSVFSTITTKTMSALEVPDVRNAPVEELESRLAPLHHTIDVACRESATLSTLRDTLLPALMDGTLRVKDVEKTVSEAL